MKKKQLIQILLKDLKELNGLANELDRSQSLSIFEIDIALSKSKLIYQEFRFLQEIEKQKEQVSAPNMEGNEAAPEKNLENNQNKDKKETVKIVSKEVQQKAISEESIIQPQNLSNTENEELKEQKTIGENFNKVKSLNDLLQESKTLDKKLANSPINKLETAIGLNDRFQYTRELFNNKPDLFRDTIKTIDQAANLEQAAAFLNANFQWTKTETSIQFAQLVKRRFTN